MPTSPAKPINTGLPLIGRRSWAAQFQLLLLLLVLFGAAAGFVGVRLLEASAERVAHLTLMREIDGLIQDIRLTTRNMLPGDASQIAKATATEKRMTQLLTLLTKGGEYVNGNKHITLPAVTTLEQGELTAVLGGWENTDKALQTLIALPAIDPVTEAPLTDTEPVRRLMEIKLSNFEGALKRLKAVYDVDYGASNVAVFVAACTVVCIFLVLGLLYLLGWHYLMRPAKPAASAWPSSGAALWNSATSPSAAREPTAALPEATGPLPAGSAAAPLEDGAADFAYADLPADLPPVLSSPRAAVLPAHHSAYPPSYPRDDEARARLVKEPGELDQISQQMLDTLEQTADSTRYLRSSCESVTFELQKAQDSLRGLAQTTQLVAKDAQDSAQLLRQSLQSVERSSNVARQGVGGMTELRQQMQDTARTMKRAGESAQGLAELRGRVDELAEQASVIALNAAIHAAGQGGQGTQGARAQRGQGMALLAEDVQRLAELARTVAAAMAQQVRTVQQETQEAMAQAERTAGSLVGNSNAADTAGQSLDEMSSLSRHLLKLVEQHANDAQRQQALIHDLSEALQQAQLAQDKTQTGAQQTVAAVARLGDVALTLKGRIDEQQYGGAGFADEPGDWQR